MLYLCDKTDTCDDAQECGGAQPHIWGGECGNCPRDKTATCVEYNKCTCMDEEDTCPYCMSLRNDL